MHKQICSVDDLILLNTTYDITLFICVITIFSTVSASPRRACSHNVLLPQRCLKHKLNIASAPKQTSSLTDNWPHDRTSPASFPWCSSRVMCLHTQSKHRMREDVAKQPKNNLRDDTGRAREHNSASDGWLHACMHACTHAPVHVISEEALEPISNILPLSRVAADRFSIQAGTLRALSWSAWNQWGPNGHLSPGSALQGPGKPAEASWMCIRSPTAVTDDDLLQQMWHFRAALHPKLMVRQTQKSRRNVRKHSRCDSLSWWNNYTSSCFRRRPSFSIQMLSQWAAALRPAAAHWEEAEEGMLQDAPCYGCQPRSRLNPPFSCKYLQG